MMGFAMKVLIADTVAPLADAAFALPNPTLAEAWLGAIAYSIQLFFDFAGYSAMAIGLGLMMGFRFIENFNNPYWSRSITEFWRRWHISLSTWLRDYLYIPLGGNRVSKARNYFNLITTMVLGGFWHGANWTFIIWGFWHGTIMAIERALGIKGTTEHAGLGLKGLFQVILTLFLVILGWVIFRAENIGVAMDMYRGMFGMNGLALSDAMSWQIKGIALAAMILGILIIYFGHFFHKMPKQAYQIMAIVIFLIAVTRLLAENYSPFLYFQF
jgi:alginate O-acetyltransferase complex protein AlgI